MSAALFVAIFFLAVGFGVLLHIAVVEDRKARRQRLNYERLGCVSERAVRRLAGSQSWNGSRL